MGSIFPKRNKNHIQNLFRFVTFDEKGINVDNRFCRNIWNFRIFPKKMHRWEDFDSNIRD